MDFLCVKISNNKLSSDVEGSRAVTGNNSFPHGNKPFTDVSKWQKQFAKINCVISFAHFLPLAVYSDAGFESHWFSS